MDRARQRRLAARKRRQESLAAEYAEPIKIQEPVKKATASKTKQTSPGAKKLTVKGEKKK